MAAHQTSRYLRYLPGIYQDIASDLATLLQPFEAQLAAFDALLEVVDAYVAPGLTPAADFLPWLAGWVALTLDEEWEESTRRRLIGQAVELYRWRGTAHGLRRYLQLYTGLPLAQIEIREGRWPAGMQIGLASRIGGSVGGALPAAIRKVVRRMPPQYHDFYVLEAAAPPDHPHVAPGTPIRRYLDAAQIVRVEMEGETVRIWPRGATAPAVYAPATITRRNQLVDDLHTLTGRDGAVVDYRGDGRIIEETPLPYRFVVRLHVPSTQYAQLVTPRWLRKVRDIIHLEKPAHTIYHLRVLRFKTPRALAPMQIGVRSTIGLDTSIGLNTSIGFDTSSSLAAISEPENHVR